VSKKAGPGFGAGVLGALGPEYDTALVGAMGGLGKGWSWGAIWRWAGYGVEVGSKLGVGFVGSLVTAAGSAVVNGLLGSKVTGM
jgi:hypothetical protein